MFRIGVIFKVGIFVWKRNHKGFKGIICPLSESSHPFYQTEKVESEVTSQIFFVIMVMTFDLLLAVSVIILQGQGSRSPITFDYDRFLSCLMWWCLVKTLCFYDLRIPVLTINGFIDPLESSQFFSSKHKKFWCNGSNISES